MKKIIIGSRGSDLALWQAHHIRSELEKTGLCRVEIKIIRTEGDRVQDKSFSQMAGQGFFTKEIEAALAEKEIDLAVHSLKDLMTVMPEGLNLAATGFREDHREAILIRPDSIDKSLPLNVKKGGVIGSSSVRRQCQVADLRPDLQLKDLRGNVPTRVNKLRDGQYDAIVIAYAGLKRLNLDVSELEMNLMDVDEFIPAPGQGILGLQTRLDDYRTNEIVGCLDDPHSRIQARLERGLLARFRGGCQLPLGAYSVVEGGAYRLSAVLGIRENDRWVGLKRAETKGSDIADVIEETYGKLT